MSRSILRTGALRAEVWARLFAVLLLLAAALPASADDYTKTKHPVVLVHGLFGFDELGGLYDYWYDIPGQLRSGGAKVYVANVSSANSSELRGEQLIDYLETLQATYGYSRFNLIGHSHGGPTARYVASVRPDLVASITSMGSPHTGSKVADGIGTAFPPGSPGRGLVAGLADALGSFLEFLSGDDDPQDALAALASLDSAGAAAFNARYPQGLPSSACGQGAASVRGVRYYSMGGTSPLSNVFDPSDLLMGAGALFFGFEANDGLVGRCSSHLGSVIRDDYAWNHLDEVNQVAGLRGLFASNPPSVYRAHLNRLKNAGL